MIKVYISIGNVVYICDCRLIDTPEWNTVNTRFEWKLWTRQIRPGQLVDFKKNT